MKHRKKRLRRKIVKTVKVCFAGRGFTMRIPIDIARNLRVEKGCKFEFITDRKKEVQKFRIIKKS